MFKQDSYSDSYQIVGVLDKATDAVDNATALAAELLERDRAGVFLYKRPKTEQLHASMSLSYDDADEQRSLLSRKKIHWSSIADFNIDHTVDNIETYIGLWVLSPNTHFDVMKPDNYQVVRDLGIRYNVDVLFSKPVPKSPNPLATAKVVFHINVSDVVPDYFTIMITYQFEGYRTLYYAMGEKCNQCYDFQKYFINLILESKLKAYRKFLHMDIALARQAEKEEKEKKKQDEGKLPEPPVLASGPCKHKK